MSDGKQVLLVAAYQIRLQRVHPLTGLATPRPEDAHMIHIAAVTQLRLATGGMAYYRRCGAGVC